MKRILALIRRDLLSTTKDQMLIYAAFAPLILALGMRFFLPSVAQATVNVVVTRDVSPQLVEQLEPYFDVEVVSDRAALERRVLAVDDVAGIVPTDDGGYGLILEGNEAHDSVVMPKIVLQRLLGGDGLQIATVDVAGPQFPFRELIGAFTAVGAFFLAGTVMALHIVEDKESRIMQLGVSPMGRLEYVAARSLLVALMSAATISGSLWLLGITHFDYLQLLLAIAVGGLAAVLVGFIIGAISGNQIAAIANIKFGALLFLMPPFVTLVIPESFWAALYWSPSFWTFVAFKAILLEGVSWPALAPALLWNLAVSLVFAALCYSWLKGKLDFALN